MSPTSSSTWGWTTSSPSHTSSHIRSPNRKTQTRKRKRRNPTRKSRTPMRRTEIHRSFGGIISPGKSSHPDRSFISHAKKIIINNNNHLVKKVFQSLSKNMFGNPYKLLLWK